MKKSLLLLALMAFASAACDDCRASQRERRVNEGQHCVEQCQGVNLNLDEVQFRNLGSTSGVVCICR